MPSASTDYKVFDNKGIYIFLIEVMALELHFHPTFLNGITDYKLVWMKVENHDHILKQK